MTSTRGLFANAVDENNPLLDTDSYKYSHFVQYPPGTEYVSAYVEARKPNGPTDFTVMFGLQMELAKLQGQVVTEEAIDEAEPFIRAHGFETALDGWRRIATVHGGKLPIKIDALPEGTVCGIRTALLRITNTDPELFWLPAFLETRILRSVWYPTTVASNSTACIDALREAMQETDGSSEGVEFKLHDFGARGTTSREAAGIGGCAHLISALGTDTVSGLVYARNYYGADMAGFSIPASEHATMTSWGGAEGEASAMENIVRQYPSGLVACVSDSYDLFRAIESYWGDQLKELVLSRTDGFLVIRPDSGDPITQLPKVIEAIGAKFGFTQTPSGYRLLNEKVRVIQGDGITPKTIPLIIKALKGANLAIGNVAFGMGAGLLQKLDRDTFGFAMKVSAICVDGEWRDVFKKPATSLEGLKFSRPGRQAVIKNERGIMETIRFEDLAGREDQLQTVFLDGEITRLQTFDEIRQLTQDGIKHMKTAKVAGSWPSQSE
ncbi:nicotinate phosphoribosyltransferase [Rhodobacteraceae bacterium RKSG542]|uniref:nicotinate phosphoribosyltransferase n=1 Tax=Pseudovibrio flavus TaxID=2529854 RepID=UPI0012BC4316|nr:nicotinate phosphoribosyltransferase [Pseudovibrio flavus]MTI16842.1 nicotinate phosphoribosyltransferase [Pseudovibrio flavus]